MNIDASWPGIYEAESRVLKIQTKLHQWANDDPGRRFDDLYNLVCDPAFLVVAWDRVRGNRGARSAGVDAVTPRSIVVGAETLLAGLRDELKARTLQPPPNPGRTWVYRFDYPNPQLNDDLGACHGGELPFVFHTNERLESSRQRDMTRAPYRRPPR